MSERYSLIFETEIEVLRSLSPLAAKVLIFMKFCGVESRSVGCREVGVGTGLSKDQASRGLRELVDASLLTVTSMGKFGRKGNVSTYKITHTPASKRDEKQSRQYDSTKKYSSTSATKARKTVAPARHKPEKQSQQRDTLKTASSASPQRRKDEEEARERDAARVALRDRLNRIDIAANAVAMSDRGFIEKAGGLEPADFLAQRYASGKLNALQLRARIAESEAGLASEEERLPVMAPTIAAGAR